MVAQRNQKPVAFGKYTLLERIAVGGMAEVFLAIQSGLEGFEKHLAIKRIRPHLCDQEAFVRMFLHEAKLAAQLQHPNIVQIFDLGRIGDSYFIAMEYISGRDMSRVVPKAERLGIQFPVEYALSIASSVLDGLSYAHGKTDPLGNPLNIVHRDITPENIMVGWNGNVKILDFGIAKANSATDMTKAGEIKGKLSYMSPEQAMGKPLDARSDIFALGIVVYEWITGYRMFTGENEMAILKNIIEGKIYPPSYFREDVPERLEEILMKALTKDREHRYQSAREMQLDVLEWLSSQEFLPSNAHLANFMKQIFVDEIEAERRALQSQAVQSRRTSAPPPEVGETVGLARTPPGGMDPAKAAALIVVEEGKGKGSSPPPAPRETPRAVSLGLEAMDLKKLEAAAKRAGVGLDELVSDLVRTTLKYL